jgi:hypothetical protein
MDSLDPIEEAARGYRERLIENGWPQPIAVSVSANLLAQWTSLSLRGMYESSGSDDEEEAES